MTTTVKSAGYSADTLRGTLDRAESLLSKLETTLPSYPDHWDPEDRATAAQVVMATAALVQAHAAVAAMEGDSPFADALLSRMDRIEDNIGTVASGV